MAVVKSDGYGHGMVPAARAALRGGAKWLGVATTDEGLTLRETEGFGKIPIMVLAPTLAEEVPALQAADLAYSVGSVSLLEAHLLHARRLNRAPRIHMQLDTGIGRDGVRFDDFEWLDILLREKAPLEGLWAHYAVSDCFPPEHVAFTKLQTARFAEALTKVRAAGLKPIAHAANSGAVLRHPDSYFDMVRPGMMIYGCDPAGPVEPPIPLRPALTLRSALSAVKWMESGDTVSYGRLFTVPDRRRIGIVPVGYGDGYMRSLSNRWHVLVRGRKVPIRGRVCMDQFMVDLSEVPEAQLGDEVVLYGRQGDERITLEETAEAAGTIPYELGCILTRRVPRIHRD
jgi:alanine racemase